MAEKLDALVRPKVANWIALAMFTGVLLAATVLLLREDPDAGQHNGVTTIETTQHVVGESGKVTTTTTTQKTTAPADRPSTADRLASPAAGLLVKVLISFGVAFLVAAGIQRALLGRYAIKVAGVVEIPEVPEAAARSIGEAVQELAAQPARTIPGYGTTTPDDTEAPVNREPEEDVLVETPEATSGLVQLRFELERVLRALAEPPPPRDGDAAFLVEVLVNRGVISAHLRASLVALLQAGDLAASGFKVPEVVRLAAEQSGPYLLRTLAERCRMAPISFEEHVLDALRAEAAPAVVHLDASLGASRFDALVVDGRRRVVVEVRSRLRPEDGLEVKRVGSLIASLPPELPVILVVAGVGLTAQQAVAFQAGRSGDVHLVRWDEEYALFGQVLRDALASDAQAS